MIVGVGTDIVWLDEFTRLVDEQSKLYMERIFTNNEISEARARANPYQVLAARLAAKEAFMKAIGTGWTDDVDWLHIEIRTDEFGRPNIILSRTTADIATTKGVTKIHVSMSHVPMLASAFVVLEA